MAADGSFPGFPTGGTMEKKFLRLGNRTVNAGNSCSSFCVRQELQSLD